jgi:DNA polymerase-3 subunit beta
MELKVKELLEAVKKAGQVVKGKSTIPIIENVLINSREGLIYVRGTNLENTISANFKSEVEFPSVAVDPHKLAGMLAAVKEETVTIELTEGLMTIKSGKLKFNLPTMPGDEFPAIEDVEGIKTLGVIEHKYLKYLDAASNYVGNDEIRPTMMCVALFADKSLAKMKIAATDAHKLVEYVTYLNVQDEPKDPLLIPGVSIKLLKKTFNDDITIRYNGKNVFFSQEGVSFIVRQVDGKFPNYQAVIPTDNPVSMTFDKTELLEALNTASLTINEAGTIKLDIGRMDALMSAEDLDFNYGSVIPLGVHYEGPEDNFTVGVNYKFLKQIVKDVDANEIKIEGSQPTRAMVIHNTTEDYDLTSLVMPVMLN